MGTYRLSASAIGHRNRSSTSVIGHRHRPSVIGHRSSESVFGTGPSASVPPSHLMILVGQYDSPFVRRIAITLHLYALAFTRDRTSVFSPDMAARHPLVRIPSLVLDDGETLFDSAAILDHLDETVGPDKSLVPRSGAPRRRVLRTMFLATGAIEKAGAIVYERHLHAPECVSKEWVTRCRGQLDGALAHLEKEGQWPWYAGDKMTQAD